MIAYIEIIIWLVSLLLFIYFIFKRKINNKKCYKDKIKIGVVLGSGGHTYEMLEIIKVLKKESKNYKYKKFSFLFFYANNDRHSKKKAEKLLFSMKKEEELKSENVIVKSKSNIKEEIGKDKDEETFFISIPRCRNVGESVVIAFFKFLFSFMYCLFLVFPMDINVLIANGPGLCLPVVFSFFFKKIFFYNKVKIVYIESVARIYSLSLTGKILYYFVDMFVAFSEILKSKYKRIKYYGYLF